MDEFRSNNIGQGHARDCRGSWLTLTPMHLFSLSLFFCFFVGQWTYHTQSQLIEHIYIYRHSQIIISSLIKFWNERQIEIHLHPILNASPLFAFFHILSYVIFPTFLSSNEHLFLVKNKRTFNSFIYIYNYIWFPRFLLAQCLVQPKTCGHAEFAPWRI